MFEPFLFLHFLSVAFSTSDELLTYYFNTTINLSPWLQDFSECDINIIPFQRNTFTDTLNIPVTVNDYKSSKYIFNQSHLISIRKRFVFCVVQVYLITDINEFRSNNTDFRKSMKSAFFPDPYCSPSVSRSALYSWTHCINVIAGLDEISWGKFSEVKTRLISKCRVYTKF